MKRIALTLTAVALSVAVAAPAEAAQPRTWRGCDSPSALNCVHVGGKGEASYMRWLRNAHDPSKVTLKFVTRERAIELLSK